MNTVPARRTRTRAALLVLPFAAACGSEPPPVITVGEISFTENDLLGLTDDRRRTLAVLAGVGLAVADSSTDRLGSPLVEEWTDDRRLEILAAELTLEKNGVGDDVLEANYLTDPRWELTVRHILFFSERWRSAGHRAAAETKAARAMESLRGGADFATTAAELSEEPGAEGRQGLLTPGREGSWVPEFWTAALALQPGEISPVTETEYGYHILRLEERVVVPFTEARSVVARGVAAQIENPGAVLEDWWADRGSSAEGRRVVALAEARSRSIEVPEAEQAELFRAWDDQVYRWSATLGFPYGASPSAVAAAALAALSRAGQGADLVRREIWEHADLIRSAYPPTFLDPA